MADSKNSGETLLSEYQRRQREEWAKEGYTPGTPARKGRPRMPVTQRRLQTSVSVPLAELEYLQTLGNGSISYGISKLIAAAKEHEAKLAAVKAAAERRDQSTVKAPIDTFD